jgi:hypothetical protein
MRQTALVLALAMALAAPLAALERQDVIFKVFQFPPDKIPTIDGDPSDWDIVPDSYAIGMDQLEDTEAPGGHGTERDPKDLDIKVKIGWVKGLNRLFFLYKAYDNYWDFSRLDLHNDIFEVVVDGDLSGGPLIDISHKDLWTTEEVGNMANIDPRISKSDSFFSFQGVHAQNYHIFTPAVGKDWVMAWECANYVKEMPYANHATKFNFKPGESGNLVLEFWITPFDYAGCEGPQRAVESVLTENKLIGLSFAVIDYDDVNSKKRHFWNLSHKQWFFGNASDLVMFKLMPLEPQFRKPIDARWSFKVLDEDSRTVAFHDDSEGDVKSWRWDFGDGTESTERNPIHQYPATPGRERNYTAVLYVNGPAGESHLAKVWDVHIRNP